MVLPGGLEKTYKEGDVHIGGQGHTWVIPKIRMKWYYFSNLQISFHHFYYFSPFLGGVLPRHFVVSGDKSSGNILI